ncbi:DUF2507 domain-containing protein [Alkalicoccus daliensis]|uniref:DUF2507 domain-containing protein n=1 Tax=Alkalicoccus daliensis TaxID=745820 RepID=A0A1H0CH98_9BACI|nr:DUF2507 domain-containing protein [Alkalicoccus daliensis]SDN57266.1 Protein of unknown function [Alkalicoccus daliensis]
MPDETQNLISPYSYDVLRHELLPILLGEEENIILYWGGKSLARKHKLMETEALQNWFQEANWGRLELIKDKKNERTYEVTTSSYEADRPYSLETGFIAQMVELEKELLAEASYEVKKKKPVVFQITVRWDKKDPTAPNAPLT